MYKINEILNTIIQGDCLIELKKIPSNSIDAIFADPPYFMQTEGQLIRVEGTNFDGVNDEWDKFKDYKEYDIFCINWLKECKRILKPDGSIWVIGSFQNIYRIGYIMQNLGYWILNDVIWFKNNPAPNFRGVRFTNAHETMLWCSKEKNAKYKFNYKTMKFLNAEKQEKSVWNISLCTGNERIRNEDGTKAHNTQKPKELLKKIILSTTFVNDIILDPFMGSGTTGAVAKELDRKYIGIEKSEEYIKIANKRIKNVEISNDFIYQNILDKKEPKVPMDKLIESKFLEIGQKLYSPDKKIVVEITNDGHVSDTVEKLSIHKMSAKYLGKESNNGWDFWILENNKPLNNLRIQYRKEVLNYE